MREERIVTYRPYGNKFLYSEDSLDAYWNKGIVHAEPRLKIVERLVPVRSTGSDNTQKNFKAMKTKEKIKGGQKMRWVQEKAKENGKPNGCFRLNCGDFSLKEYQRNGKVFYDMDFRDEEGRHTKSLRKLAGRPIRDRTDAYETARGIRNAMYEKQATLENPDITYSEYLPQFLEKVYADKNVRYPKAIEQVVRKLEKWFGDFSLIEINKYSAEKYRNHRRKMEDLSNFILNTSMRIINIIQLKWDDIRWDEKPVPIAFVDKEIHKNKKEDGEYLLNPEILEMLKRRQAENGKSELVFVRYESGRPKAITHSWIQRHWRAVKKKANEALKAQGSDLRIPKELRFYDLKATCLSRAGANGATENQLMAISNHADPQSLKRYVRKKALQESAIELIGNGVKNRSVN